MATFRRIAAQVDKTLSGGPFLLLVLGVLSYRFVHDDHWPWWLPIVFFAAACAIGVFLGWRKARKRNR